MNKRVNWDAVMVDLETFGPAPKGAIVSIGAVAFNYDGTLGETFYENVTKSDREMNEETVRWWLQQSEEARMSLFDPSPVTIGEALNHLKQFVDLAGKPDIWANGVTFDIALLRDAYKDWANLGRTPWGYKQEMCLRPIRALGKRLGIAYEEVKARMEIGKQHNALHDAVVQAQYLCQVFAKCGGRDGNGS